MNRIEPRLSQQPVLFQLSVEISLADSEDARGVAAMAMAGFERAPDVHQLQLDECGQGRAIHGGSSGKRTSNHSLIRAFGPCHVPSHGLMLPCLGGARAHG